MHHPKLNPIDQSLVSDELHEKTIGYLNKNLHLSLGYKTRVIHMVDSVSRGYTTPAEAYDAMKADYFPIYLELRESAYRHLIK